MEIIIYSWIYNLKSGNANVKNLDIIANVNLEFLKQIKMLVSELHLFSG